MHFPQHEVQVYLDITLGNQQEETLLKVFGKIELILSTLGSILCSNVLLVLHILLQEEILHRIALEFRLMIIADRSER